MYLTACGSLQNVYLRLSWKLVKMYHVNNIRNSDLPEQSFCETDPVCLEDMDK